MRCQYDFFTLSPTKVVLYYYIGRITTRKITFFNAKIYGRWHFEVSSGCKPDNHQPRVLTLGMKVNMRQCTLKECHTIIVLPIQGRFRYVCCTI